MDSLEAWLDFRRNEELPDEQPVRCCNCGQWIPDDQLGEYADAETGELACGDC